MEQGSSISQGYVVQGSSISQGYVVRVMWCRDLVSGLCGAGI